MFRPACLISILSLSLLVFVSFSYSIPAELGDKIKEIYYLYWIRIHEIKDNSTMDSNKDGISEEEKIKAAHKNSTTSYSDLIQASINYYERYHSKKNATNKIIESVKGDIDTWIGLLNNDQGIIKYNQEKRAELIHLLTQHLADLDKYLARPPRLKSVKR